jgi:hypothetical protein
MRDQRFDQLGTGCSHVVGALFFHFVMRRERDLLRIVWIEV